MADERLRIVGVDDDGILLRFTQEEYEAMLFAIGYAAAVDHEFAIPLRRLAAALLKERTP